MWVAMFYNYYCLENNHDIEVSFRNVYLYILYIHQASCYARDGFFFCIVKLLGIRQSLRIWVSCIPEFIYDVSKHVKNRI